MTASRDCGPYTVSARLVIAVSPADDTVDLEVVKAVQEELEQSALEQSVAALGHTDVSIREAVEARKARLAAMRQAEEEGRAAKGKLREEMGL